MSPLVSIIMPSYNCEKTIARALQSIKNQTLSEQIEILLIDGGSTDKTLEIAKDYDVTILHNPDRLPEPAKHIGVLNAKGKYIVRQDTDEVYTQSEQLEKRIKLFSKHSELKCIICENLLPGENCGISANYLSYCGDPFTQFIYMRGSSWLETFKSNLVEYSPDGCIFKFSDKDLVPLGDGGTTIFDFEWIKQSFKDKWQTLSFTCSMFENVCNVTKTCGCIPKDDVIHLVRADLKTYLAKLKFRVVSNIFSPEESGYSSRIKGKKNKLSSRKYLFILYVLSVVFPILDSARLSIRYRDASFLLHFFYLYYVVILIAAMIVFKAFGGKMRNAQYG